MRYRLELSRSAIRFCVHSNCMYKQQRQAACLPQNHYTRYGPITVLVCTVPEASTTAAAPGAPASLRTGACGSRCRWSPPRSGLYGRTQLWPAQPASPGAPWRVNEHPPAEHAGHRPSNAVACGGARARHAACSATPPLQTYSLIARRVLLPETVCTGLLLGGSPV